MQRPKVEEGGNFTILASTNVALQQLVDQAVVCEKAIEDKLTIDLSDSSEGICGYSNTPTHVKQMTW